MSVVNRMLRDLDQREAGSAHGIYTQQLASADAPSAWRRPLVVLLVVVALGAASWWGWNRYTAAPDAVIAQKPAPSQAPAKVAPATPAVAVADATAAANATNATKPAPTETATAAEPQAAASTPASTAAPQDTTDASAVEAPSVSATPATPTAPTAASAANATSSTAAATPNAVASNAAIAATTRHASRPAVTVRAHKTQAAAAGAAATTDDAAGHIDVRPHAAGAQTAHSEFQRAVALIGQGRHEEARAALHAALRIDPAHEGARQTLATLLMEAGKADEATALLDEGLRLNPAQTNFAIVLARLHLDRGDSLGALKVLRAHGADAKDNPEYHAFVAALLRRNGQATEAVVEYRAALALAPQMGTWWVGLGLSCEAAGQPQEALQAYTRARALGNLPPAVADLVQSKLQTVH